MTGTARETPHIPEAHDAPNIPAPKEPLTLDTQVALMEAQFALGKLQGMMHYLPEMDLYSRMLNQVEAHGSIQLAYKAFPLAHALLPYDGGRVARRSQYLTVYHYQVAFEQGWKSLRYMQPAFPWLHGMVQTLLHGQGEVPVLSKEAEVLVNTCLELFRGPSQKVPPLITLARIWQAWEHQPPYKAVHRRLRQLLVSLLWLHHGWLRYPGLLLGKTLHSHRAAYQQALQGTDEEWVAFFLGSVENAALETIDFLKQADYLRQDLMQHQLPQLGKKRDNGELLLRSLFEQPLIYGHEVPYIIHSSAPTGYALLKDFVSLGILEEQTGFNRNQVFAFRQYLAMIAD